MDAPPNPLDSSYRRLTYQLAPDASSELEEILVATLWEAGALGMEGGRIDGPVHFDPVAGDPLTLIAWFPLDAAGPAGLPAGAALVEEEEIPRTDWLASYRATASPFRLGKTFFVDPGEPGNRESVAPAGRIPLALPARTAFGTGSHASTRLAVELLENARVRGRRLLDVGCGTGVLSFCALLLGAARVTAFDLDPAAAVAVHQNAALNRQALKGRRPAVFAGPAEALTRFPDASGVDLALINVIPEEILPSLEAILRCLGARAEVLFSGILESRGESLLRELEGLGLRPLGPGRRAGEWVAFHLRREPAAERA